MSPLPVRLETKARRSVRRVHGARFIGGWETRRRASPPASGAVQMSPPLTKAISARSGASRLQ